MTIVFPTILIIFFTPLIITAIPAEWIITYMTIKPDILSIWIFIPIVKKSPTIGASQGFMASLAGKNIAPPHYFVTLTANHICDIISPVYNCDFLSLFGFFSYLFTFFIFLYMLNN